MQTEATPTLDRHDQETKTPTLEVSVRLNDPGIAIDIYKASAKLANEEWVTNLRQSLKTGGQAAEPSIPTIRTISHAIKESSSKIASPQTEADAQKAIVETELIAAGVPKKIASGYVDILVAHCQKDTPHIPNKSPEPIVQDPEAIKAVKTKRIKRELIGIQNTRVTEIAKNKSDLSLDRFMALFAYLKPAETKGELIALLGADYSAAEVDDVISRMTDADVLEFQRPAREMIGELLRLRIDFGNNNISLEYDKETIDILVEIKKNNVVIFTNKEPYPDPYENMALEILNWAAKHHNLPNYLNLKSHSLSRGLLSSQEAKNKLEYYEKMVSQDAYERLKAAHHFFYTKKEIAEMKKHHQSDRLEQAIQEISQICYENDDFYHLIGLVNTLHEMGEDTFADTAIWTVIARLLNDHNIYKQTAMARATSDHANTFFFTEYHRQIRASETSFSEQDSVFLLNGIDRPKGFLQNVEASTHRNVQRARGFTPTNLKNLTKPRN